MKEHLRATCAGFTAKNIVNVSGRNELKSFFCAILSHCFDIILKQLFTAVSVASGGYLPRRFATSTSVNSYQISNYVRLCIVAMIYFRFWS